MPVARSYAVTSYCASCWPLPHTVTVAGHCLILCQLLAINCILLCQLLAINCILLCQLLAINCTLLCQLLAINCILLCQLLAINCILLCQLLAINCILLCQLLIIASYFARVLAIRPAHLHLLPHPFHIIGFIHHSLASRLPRHPLAPVAPCWLSCYHS